MFSIAVKLTNRCNLQCKHCYDYISHHRIPDMDQKTIDASIEYIKKHALKNSEMHLITLIGGEIGLLDITILQQFFNKLEKYENIRFMISTNLLYKIDDYMPLFFRSKNPITNQPTITTSWDYDIRFKNKNQEELFLKNLEQITSNNIITSVSTVLTKKLIDNMSPKQLFDKLNSVGVQRIILEPLVLVGNILNNKELIPLNRDVDNWLVDAYKELKKYNILSEDFESLENAIIHNSNIEICKTLDKELVINTDGTLTFLKNNTNVVFGDVFGKFNQELYQKGLLCEHYHNNECIICKYFHKYCSGTCRMCKFDESGCPGHKNLFKCIEQQYGI